MRRSRIVAVAVASGLACAAAFVTLTRPRPLDPAALPPHAPDRANGAVVFRIGACYACHHPPEGSPHAAARLPVGGAPFPTPLGTFYPGNLTPDPETGLGRWSAAEFASAMTRGVAPDGRHYFPAFPWPSYARMTTADVLDLWGYLTSLPPTRSETRPAALPLEPLARRGVGLWKLVAGAAAPIVSDPAHGSAWNRGAYLVGGPGHCGECHTPRDALLRPDRGRELAGGPHPGGDGKVPSLRGLVARGRYRDAADLALALQYGETFGYDKLASGGMGKIQSELAGLPEHDLAAIAEYLVSLDAAGVARPGAP